MTHARILLTTLGLATLLAACAGPSPLAPDTTTSENAAVQLLLAQSQSELQSGHTRSADGLIERALRIAPSDPYAWHALALSRVAQHPRQALDLARKSNTLAGSGNSALQAANWMLIGQAWAALGHARRAAAAKAHAQAITGP